MLLVTGASGLLGANLVLTLHKCGLRVAALARRSRWELDGVVSIQMDLLKARRVEALVGELCPSAVIHCAAATDVDWCEGHPPEAQAINVEAAGALAAAARRAGSRFAYISTDAVFDGHTGSYAEESVPNPVNVYARSKLEGERAALAALPSSLVVRTNFFGWNAQPKASLAEWVLRQIEQGKTVPGFTDVFFSPLLANDLGDLVLQLIDRGAEGVLHVAARDGCSKFEFARKICAAFGHDPARVVPSSLTAARLRAPRPLNTTLNTGRAAAALGRALPAVDEGVARLRRLYETGWVRTLATCLKG